MTTPDDLSDREIELAELRSSDEDVEALLSGGADIDDLIAAGVLEVDEPTPDADEEEDEAIEFEPGTLSGNDLMTLINQQEQWLVANGHKRRPVRI